MSGNPQRRRVYILWSVLFGAVLLAVWMREANAPVPEKQMRAYDDVSELNQNLKEDGMGERNKPALDMAPPPPPAVTSAYEVGAGGEKEFICGGDDKPACDELWPSQTQIHDGATEAGSFRAFSTGAYLTHKEGPSHLGLYEAWLLENGLLSDAFMQDQAALTVSMLDRSVSPMAVFQSSLGIPFPDLLSEEARMFTKYYFEAHEPNYMTEFNAAFGGSEKDVVLVTPSWENYDRIKPVISRRYEEWKAESAKP